MIGGDAREADRALSANGATDQEPSVSGLLWYVLGRAFIVTLFLGGTVVVGMSHPFAFFHFPDLRLIFLLSVTFLQICFSLLWLLLWQRRLRQFVQFQLVWDLLLCLGTVYITGGITSLFSFTFIFVILSCALVASRAELYSTIVAAVILYAGLVSLQFYGYLPLKAAAVELSPADVVYRLFLNVAAFLLAGLLGAVLSARLRRSQQLLEREQHDHAELEMLNSAILRSIPSGLIVVDGKGWIHSFNSAAAQISGVAVEKALELNIKQIFAAVDVASMTLPQERKEFVFVASDGDERIIGYSARHITTGDNTSILLTFQDLTESKKLEESLRLGERLAAVGALAAGLAHEIRNPLASLSGSVQLLAEQGNFGRVDRQLLDIVHRETSRLNRLVSDFLVFAKPRQPECERCDIGALLRELVALMSADPAYADVDIDCGACHECSISADVEQIRQALWNLLVNAAIFALEPKQVQIGMDCQRHCFWIDDNGPGVAENIKKRIFEPFYTTRASGTGLGLSIVHAIVSAHGGTIECLDSPLGGTRMQVYLPVTEE